MAGNLYTDNIGENTPGNGVSIDSLIARDGFLGLVRQSSLPANPAAGEVWLFVDDADGGIYVKYSDGTLKKFHIVQSTANNTACFPAASDSSYGYYKVLTVGSNAGGNFMFHVPIDFQNLISLVLVAIVSSGAAQTSRDIDLASNYAALNSVYNQYSEANTSILYNLSGLTDKIAALDISSVFSQIVAGMICGLQITHNGIGGDIYYLGIMMEYN